MNMVQTVEQRLVPQLHLMADVLSRAFAIIRVQVYSLAYGERTPTPSHVLGLNCVFPRRDHYPDKVTLEIVLGQMRQEPAIEADVEWGYPGFTEVDLLPGVQPLTEATLTRAAAGLPGLFGALRAAVLRGHPPSASWGLVDKG